MTSTVRKSNRPAENVSHEDYRKLKGYMVENGITVKDSAEVLNVKSPAIYARISGKTEFTLAEVRKLQFVFGMDISVFS